jgi:hypothetical protein
MLSVWTTSIGSSIVTMCARRVRLMNPISAEIVVVFLEREVLWAHPPDRETHGVGLAQDVHAEAADAFERVGEVRLLGARELLRLVGGHQRVRGRARVRGGKGGERSGQQLAVDPYERDVARLQMDVARPPLHRVAKQFRWIHGRSLPGRFLPGRLRPFGGPG